MNFKLIPWKKYGFLEWPLNGRDPFLRVHIYAHTTFPFPDLSNKPYRTSFFQVSQKKSTWYTEQPLRIWCNEVHDQEWKAEIPSFHHTESNSNFSRRQATFAGFNRKIGWSDCLLYSKQQIVSQTTKDTGVPDWQTSPFKHSNFWISLCCSPIENETIPIASLLTGINWASIGFSFHGGASINHQSQIPFWKNSNVWTETWLLHKKTKKS